MAMLMSPNGRCRGFRWFSFFICFCVASSFYLCFCFFYLCWWCNYCRWQCCWCFFFQTRWLCKGELLRWLTVLLLFLRVFFLLFCFLSLLLFLSFFSILSSLQWLCGSVAVLGGSQWWIHDGKQWFVVRNGPSSPLWSLFHPLFFFKKNSLLQTLLYSSCLSLFFFHPFPLFFLSIFTPSLLLYICWYL